MNPSGCPEFQRLRANVDAALQQLIELTNLLLQVFRAGDYKVFARYDKELENAIGQKERAIGAIKQHALEHQCAPAGNDFERNSLNRNVHPKSVAAS